MKFSTFAMNRDRKPAQSRPPVRTLAEFASETGQTLTVLGRAVAKQGLRPCIGKSYSLKELRAIIL